MSTLTSTAIAADPKDAIHFKQQAYGLWRYETSRHRLEIRLCSNPDSMKRHDVYEGQITLRPTGYLIARDHDRQFHLLQRRLVATYVDVARSDKPIRQIITFEEFSSRAGVKAYLQRRCDAYLKRYNLSLISSAFSTGCVGNRNTPTTILTVKTETKPVLEP